MGMGNVEIPKWLKDLPLAPEFHPTDTEFADPIAYISKIEKKATAFGICKIIPPLPKPSKRYVFGNLNKSLSKCPELGDSVNLSNASSLKKGLQDIGNDGEARAVFTTRHQELGQDIKKTKGTIKENPQLGVHKQVWQSGEIYTLDQFESKSKAFAKSLLGMFKEISPLVIETLFWKAASDKPIHVEYANDVPGSAFGEPEDQFKYFHIRRRKRASYKSYRRSAGSSDCKEKEIDNVNNLDNDEMKGTAMKNEPSMSSETISRSSITSSVVLSEEILRSSKRKSVNANNDMEGTAGWKLSNSPWNLQVIARSPGSLTRFMPDDIPGVTSPMIYIGMLFSWFAWHVEDHELHSMNFLHTGSAKTWYAVPGDHAFTFEEVIRMQAYGGGIDRLAALTLLGEKTTLLSPEVIVSSGIPCCRLIQNPGEFVVTFPRAYHVGFSHGFNCGEAANFGTPQWLKVAKEAAVRRAAMNYLPMLSHQQLLYLLTMSFVSRVPRSLLPGARSSRLRDRLKEERELSVKKAFIEDMLKENNILSALLGKDSICNVVIWNPDLLPCANKDFQVPSTVTATTEEIVSSFHSKDNSSTTENDLFKEMSLYMETLNDLYVDDDGDLSDDFQVDSGTLACVACGILGFPFMSVVQPSDTALAGLLDHPLVQEGSIEESGNLPLSRGWNNSSKFLRPRIFCLEHGVQIEELLRSKGGANMLLICHSDYQKIRAHAAAIAEEIDTPFNYNEIPLESASQEDLNLIYIAIDSEDHDDCGEDWTSKLAINLRYCVKVRKNSPSNKVQHALALGGLFSDETSSDFLNIKWQSRRSRSRIKLNRPAHCKPQNRVETNKENILGKTSDNVIVKTENKLIQYTRRKYKVKIDCSARWNQGCPRKHTMEQVSGANCEDLVKHTRKTSKITPAVEISRSDAAGSCMSPIGMSGVLHEVQVLEATDEMCLNSASLHVTGPVLTANPAIERVVRQVEIPLEKSNRFENVSTVSARVSFKIQHEEKVNGVIIEDEDSSGTNLCSQCVTAAERSEMEGEYHTTKNISLTNEAREIFCEGQYKILGDRDVLANELLILLTQLVYMFLTLLDTLKDQHAVSLEESTECLQETCAEEDKLQHEIEITSGINKELIPNIVMNDQNHVSVAESSEILKQPCISANLFNVTLKRGMQQGIQFTKERKKEHCSCSITQMGIDQPNAVSEETISEALGGTSAKNLWTGSILDFDMLLKVPTVNRSKVENIIPNSTNQIQDPVIPVIVEEYSEVPRASSVFSVGLNLETKLQKPIHSDDVVYRDDEVHEVCQTPRETNEERLLSHITQISQQSPAQIKRCFGTEEESYSTGNVFKGQDDCSSHELESAESAVVDPRSTVGKGRKRKNEVEHLTENKLNNNGFIISPCEGLRPRAGKDATFRNGVDIRKSAQENPMTKKARKPVNSVPNAKKKEIAKRSYKCDLEGCPMSFETRAELLLHKRNRCPYEGCRKRFNSHRYAIIHQRVHEDDRPLKCPWKDCSMSFKWAWARTEHMRVHTGEKPYKCKVEGCGRTFRFVSDFSRHRRKTGHCVNTPA
ncbi:conserved hypothetical protein [Ricinus communis]|uniref:Lysine-specific demethylase ELF6 n=1 Tax=Ricinus communis TaxID=3988 RepID=B9T0B7_RICCO|nr:conserved hypothetical protein [Ricinus communis]